MPASPFPQGTVLPNGEELGRLVRAVDPMFWIHATKSRRRALLMAAEFAKVPAVGTAALPDLDVLSFAGGEYRVMVTDGTLDIVGHLPRPTTVDQALAFATALRRTDKTVQGAIYDEAGKLLLPYSDPSLQSRDKAEVLGLFLTGGIEVRADDVVALEQILPKFDVDDLEAIVIAAGLELKSTVRGGKQKKKAADIRANVGSAAIGPFELPGRPALADFFNEHVIDIVADEERYASLGIGFPGGIVLEGPTGCGKTFAVERLIEHLGWPSFHIEASSVASPYIHETSRKVAQVFAEATKAAPAVIVIDEMDAFLASRDTGSQQHHVEEVAEFLRRIPEAAKNRVLVIGMTNQVDAIDPAILRRGRFDHVIHVDHAGRDEVAALLSSLLSEIPNDVPDLAGLAAALAGRPLSDVSFVVREAARLTARGKKERIGPDEIASALAKSPSRNSDEQRRIGF
ncbi:MAG: AAA family ATPase [Sphingomonas sp.]|uniref:ATP-binding protein n=1 Tax=Sphingomonas sp. TaxID=28214 RepID=UPI001AD2E9F0|nr:ATP-binding protein [Sphingomonas sp.]MBN8807821.1 AAA family ATPase [Sphingomonas sp.]